MLLTTILEIRLRLKAIALILVIDFLTTSTLVDNLIVIIISCVSRS